MSQSCIVQSGHTQVGRVTSAALTDRSDVIKASPRTLHTLLTTYLATEVTIKVVSLGTSGL